MKIVKNNYEINLTNEKNNEFIIHFAAGDLYWTMVDYYVDNEFGITKDDDLLFKQFENLFLEIKKHDNPYNKLLNNDCFEWISEAYGLMEDANRLIILKDNDNFIIKFFQNPKKVFRKDICTICFCLSGSKNQDIANLFSYMLHEMIQYIEIDNNKTKILNNFFIITLFLLIFFVHFQLVFVFHRCL